MEGTGLLSCARRFSPGQFVGGRRPHGATSTSRHHQRACARSTSELFQTDAMPFCSRGGSLSPSYTTGSAMIIPARPRRLPAPPPCANGGGVWRCLPHCVVEAVSWRRRRPARWCPSVAAPCLLARSSPAADLLERAPPLLRSSCLGVNVVALRRGAGCRQAWRPSFRGGALESLVAGRCAAAVSDRGRATARARVRSVRGHLGRRRVVVHGRDEQRPAHPHRRRYRGHALVAAVAPGWERTN